MFRDNLKIIKVIEILLKVSSDLGLTFIKEIFYIIFIHFIFKFFRLDLILNNRFYFNKQLGQLS